MSLFTGTGPGVYTGVTGPALTEADAALSGIRNSGSVNDINVPYHGTPYQAARQAIDNGDQATFDYLKQNYSF